MLAGQPLFFISRLQAILAGLILICASSCTIVKNYPRNRPYVYKTNINVIADMPSDEKDLLTERLENQLDDSMRPRAVNKILWKVMRKPPAYDVANADKSVLFMRSLLVSLGYFYDSTSYKVAIDSSDSAEGRLPATVTFDVVPGKLTRLDTVVYKLDTPPRHPNQPELQALTMNNLNEAVIKKDDPFSKAPISSELDRLIELYRQNGYLRISREELLGVWDTLDVALLEASPDPFEQLEILQKLAERRKNPTANLEIRFKPGFDSARLVKYYIGNIYIYPDYNPDTTGMTRSIVQVDTGMYVIQHGNKFKPKIFPINIYLRYTDLYNQRRVQRTLTRLNNIGAWRLINILPEPRPGQDTVDFRVHLTPSTKYLFTANLEAFQNQTAIAGNLFGMGINLGIQNRNFARAANQATTNVRYGVELGDKFIQTQQFSISHNIYFPRPVPNFKRLPERLRDNVRTVFSFNGANTERRELYNLTTINGSWGYEYQRNRPRFNRTEQITVKIPNIEYSYLKQRDSLQRLIEKSPALRNIFTDGFISSVILGYTRAHSGKVHQSIWSVNVEHSPFLAGFIPSDFLDTNLYRFTKLSLEYTHLIKIRRSAVALRGFVGVGYESGNTVNENKQNNLPFFKQYFAGGPNSMRAWRLRKLGPGSVLKDFEDNPERYGDVQLELNAEYRFPITDIAGVKLEGALFTDIGNIWFLKKAAGEPEEVFNFGRLGKDLAVGVGTGLRVDFTFFLLRVDYSYKAKDPSPEPDNAAAQNKWFYNFQPLKGQLQIGINYPFKL
ncbi:MAG TPA: BamA/TamA family outer membrane protein [Chitinophagaceae bacterium]|nr:BamA/TamA family outer membrane protein [Chitinophagaceae bacterium]